MSDERKKVFILRVSEHLAWTPPLLCIREGDYLGEIEKKGFGYSEHLVLFDGEKFQVPENPDVLQTSPYYNLKQYIAGYSYTLDGAERLRTEYVQNQIDWHTKDVKLAQAKADEWINAMKQLTAIDAEMKGGAR